MSDTQNPKCVAIFAKNGGIRTSRELVEGLSLLMGDLAEGTITNGRANAICNAAGKILTTVKLEHQHGTRQDGDGHTPTLQLISGAGAGQISEGP